MPAFSAIWRSGSSSARRTMRTPTSSSPSALTFPGPGDVQQGDAAAGDDAFLDRRAGGGEGVLDAVFFSFSSVSVARPP